MGKTILIDFDGTIHSYTSGWQGATEINDPPVVGAIDALKAYIDHGYDVCIYSSRSKEEGAILSMMMWLCKHNIGAEYCNAIRFPTEKPAAWLTIDDRAIQFNGVFPSLDEIDNFKPWNK